MGKYWQLFVMKPWKYVLFQMFLVGCFGVEGARILGLFPFPAPSHYKQGAKLMQELSKRGHEVTIVAPFTQSDENITEIVIKEKDKIIRNALRISPYYKKEINYFDHIDESWITIFGNVVFTDFLAMYIIEEIFRMPEIVKLLEMDFDLVVADAFAGESLIGFASNFDCPYVILNPIASSIIVNDWVSNPAPFSYVPSSILRFTSQMTFWQRVTNTWVGYTLQIFKDYYHLPKQEKLLKKFFKGSPGLHELFDKHLSLVLLNSNPIINYPQPLVPSIIEIGGFHVDAPKALPKDLQEFLDGAEHGVILLSFGSILKSVELPLHKRDAIIKTLSKLKQKVIWKYENDSLPGKPPNVKISKWLPINDILAHPNLKLFITHAGLLSTIEAIHHGVPILGIPVSFDQFGNIFKAVKDQYGLVLPFQQLSEESFDKALKEILGNASYGKTARKLSTLFKDQPVGALDKAIFWVEHVLRNGGQHLRTAGDKLHWIQLYLLDVLLCIFLFYSFWIFMAVWCYKKIHLRQREKLKYN